MGAGPEITMGIRTRMARITKPVITEYPVVRDDGGLMIECIP
jgi:hypothetical protein